MCVTVSCVSAHIKLNMHSRDSVPLSGYLEWLKYYTVLPAHNGSLVREISSNEACVEHRIKLLVGVLANITHLLMRGHWLRTWHMHGE